MKDLKQFIQSKNVCIFLCSCGVIFSTLDFVMFNILGFMRPGYNPFTQFISELGETGSSNAHVASIYFFISGIFTILFALGLYIGIKKEKGSIFPPIILILYGIFNSIGTAIFPCDPGCAGSTFTGLMHLFVSFIALILMCLLPLFSWRSFKKDDNWKQYELLTLVFGILIIVLSSIFLIFYSIDLLIGLFQRLLYYVFLLWIFLIAVKLLKIQYK